MKTIVLLDTISASYNLECTPSTLAPISVDIEGGRSVFRCKASVKIGKHPPSDLNPRRILTERAIEVVGVFREHDNAGANPVAQTIYGCLAEFKCTLFEAGDRVTPSLAEGQ